MAGVYMYLLAGVLFAATIAWQLGNAIKSDPQAFADMLAPYFTWLPTNETALIVVLALGVIGVLVFMFSLIGVMAYASAVNSTFLAHLGFWPFVGFFGAMGGVYVLEYEASLLAEGVEVVDFKIKNLDKYYWDPNVELM